MYKDKRIGVVVPAYNEQSQIRKVLETIPDFVDRILVVDDRSTDDTVRAVDEFRRESPKGDRVHLVVHDTNQGVGGAIVTGYKRAVEEHLDIAVVMAGDGQMNPGDLPAVLDPVAAGEADYAKGNRLVTGEAWHKIPHYRYLGNAVLSLFTKIASGYWHIADSQSGYTATSRSVLERIPLNKLYKRYGFPNHILVMLNVYNCRVRDVEIEPVYNVGERSGIRLHRVIPCISWLLFAQFIWRMKEKYIVRDFHPLVFFYGLAWVLAGGSVGFTVRLVYLWVQTGHAPPMTSLALVFCIVTALQSTFFAMWFDMECNRHLR
jgi:glycosyltransferase involved in cell wall biosynthesis